MLNVRFNFQAANSPAPATTRTGQHNGTPQNGQYLRQPPGPPQQQGYAPQSALPQQTANNGPIKSIPKPSWTPQPSKEERLLQEIRAALEQIRLSEQHRLEHDRRMMQLEENLRREVDWLRFRREQEQRRK